VGLSSAQLAELTDYEEERVQAWESGHVPVPLAVAEILIQLDECLDHAAATVQAQFRQHLMKGSPVRGEVSLLVYHCNGDLWRYRAEFQPLPATLHAALVLRCRKALTRLRIPVRLVYMESDAYEQWRRGRADTELTRAQWAALQ
jgi:hypothetical protein